MKKQETAGPTFARALRDPASRHYNIENFLQQGTLLSADERSLARGCWLCTALSSEVRRSTLLTYPMPSNMQDRGPKIRGRHPNELEQVPA